MLTLDRIVLACLLLTLAAVAESPFYTSKKLGILVRQPPGWSVIDKEALTVADPGGSARARFELVPGKDASVGWKNTLSSLQKSHQDFTISEELMNTPRGCLIQARFQEAGADWNGTYVVKPFEGKLLVASSESKKGTDSKVLTWLGSVVESVTPVR